jgi:hypothetical protein
MKVDDSKAGKVGRCLKCNQKFLVPREARKATRDVGKDPPARPAHEEGLAAFPESDSDENDEPPPPRNEADILRRRRYGIDEDGNGDIPIAQPVAIDDVAVAERVEMQAAALPLRLSKRKERLLVVGLPASVLVGIVLIVWIIRILARPAPDEDADAVTGPLVPHLRLEAKGEKFDTMLEVMTFSRIRQGQSRIPESFQVEGKGVSIYGRFPTSPEDELEALIGKPAAITREDPAGTHSDSYVHLSGQGDLKVLSGTLVIKEVIVPGKRRNPYLRGEIEMALKKKDQREPLHAKGTFEAPAEILE